MKKILIYIIILTLFSLESSAQSKSVTGTVIDDIGIIIGATILEKGTSNGVVADSFGEFKINLSTPNPVLIVSTLGYVTQEVVVGARTSIVVTLETSATAIDDLVVIGYGTQTKATVTGSVVQMSADVLIQSPSLSAANALTGRLAGVTTQQSSGKPGEDAATIYIRGSSSLNSSSSPLVMVDGVERDFSSVDTEDIESISVLKDASTTAIYGVRGANGVILITTKRGKVGKAVVKVVAEFGLQEVMRLPTKADSWQHAALQNEGAINEGVAPNFTEEDILLYASGTSPFTHPNTNFMDTFLTLAPQQKYSVNVTGGTEVVKYFVAVSYTDQQGNFQTDMDKLKETSTLKELYNLNPELHELVPTPNYDAGHGFKRLNIRTNLDFSLTEDLDFSIDLSYRNDYINAPKNNPDFIYGVFARTPNIFPLLNENGTFGLIGSFGMNMNPLVTIAHQGYRVKVKNSLEGTLNLKYRFDKLVKGLSWNLTGSLNTYSNNERSISEEPDVWYYNYSNDSYNRMRRATLPVFSSSSNAAEQKIFASTAFKYDNDFGGHTITGLLLANLDYTKKPGSGTYSNIPLIYQGIIGRATYKYRNRYLFEVNFGYNGSNRFEEGSRYALFPSVSAAWILTGEKFMSGSSDVISFLKLKASVGQVGSDAYTGSFSYFNEILFQGGDDYTFGEPSFLSPGGITEGLALAYASTWEVVTKYNVGIESKFFDNRLIFNMDVFYDLREGNLISTEQYILAAGASKMPQMNIGKTENKGFEAELNWSDAIGRDFKYSIGGLFSFTRNKILERAEQIREYDYQNRTGHRISQTFGYISDGLFQSYDEIAAHATQFGVLQPGDIRYKDLNGDGVINEKDITAYGYSHIPEMTFSANIGVEWKGIALSVLFQGAANATSSLGYEVDWEFFNQGTIMTDRHLDRWTPESASTATYHRLTNVSKENLNNTIGSDYYARSGNYLKLKNIHLSYSLPGRILKKSPISQFKVFATANNLVTWDSVGVVDPESQTKRQYFYPQTRVYNFGINLIF